VATWITSCDLPTRRGPSLIPPPHWPKQVLATLESHCEEHGIRLHGIRSGRSGIFARDCTERVSPSRHDRWLWRFHTSTHGAFGAIAFASAPARLRDVLGGQSLSIDKLKGAVASGWRPLPFGCYAKDLILHMIAARGQKVAWAMPMKKFAGRPNRSPLDGGTHGPSWQHGRLRWRRCRLRQSRCTTFSLLATAGPMAPQPGELGAARGLCKAWQAG